MAEARLYGDVDEGKVWSTGALNALIEGGTEQIPLVRYLDGMGATARRALGKSVADAAVSNGAARRELGKLLELGRRELGGKFLTRTTAEEYLKDVTAEGGSEFLAEGLQTLVPLIYQRPEDYPTLREVVENGLEGFKGGAFMGAFLGAGSRTVGHFAQQRRRKQQGTVYLAKRADGSVVEIIGHEGDMVTALAPGGEVMRFPYAEIKDHAEVSYEEFSRGLAGQVEREAEAEAAKARAASNPDTGEYVRVTLKDGTQANVVSGIPEAGGTLVVEDDAGNRRQVPVEGLVPESVQAVPAEEMAARAAESVRQAARDAEEASQLEARPGDEFTMPDGKRYRIEQDLRAQGGGYLSVPLDAEGNADYTSGETLQSTPEEMAYYLLAERRSAGQKAQGNGNNGGQNIPENGNIGQENIPAPTTVTGQPVQTEAVHLNNEATTTQVADTQQRQPTEITKQLSALERIPKDEKGEPVYEQADADTAWDAIVEQSEGDEATAKAVADSMVADKEAELKKVEKAKPRGGTTVAEKIAAERERKNAVEQAKATLAHWQRIAQTAERRRQAAMAEQANAAAEAARTQREQEEAERIEREEAERVRREALNGVPDLADDTPRDARARGYRRVSGEKIDRQQPLPAKQGKAVQVKFDDRNIPAGRVSLIEAEQLQPSHLNGRRNPLHFIDEAQPKERNDEASVLSARKIASNIRPEEITTSVTAYTGAPTVNARGEVVQGNNRSAALREMWAGHPEQAAKYKQYLTDHAADFGLTPEDVESMRHPVLVNMLDVSDEDAIRLGQFVAQDTESGGVERIKPRNIVQKMGGDMRSYANQLLKSTDDEASFAELVDRNGIGTLKWMRTKGYITPTQYKSAFDSRGNLTAEAKNDLKGIMFQSIFQNGNTHLEEMFNLLPPKAQKAILATAYRDYDSPNSERMNMELQDSISAYYALSQMPEFANAKNYKEARIAAEAWKRQLALDDVTGESYLPSERYSNFAILLATMYKGQTQMFIQNTFKNIYDLVQGTQEETLFETPDNTPRTLVEAINETLSGLSDELLLNGNFIYDGQRRNNVLAGSSAAGQEGRQGGTRSPETGGRTENGNESADRADRVTDGTGNSRNERNGGENQEGEEKEKSAQERLTKEEAAEIIADMEEHAEVAPEMALTIENWDAEFGEEGIVNTPLGEVKMGENQFTKMMRKGRNSKLGMIKPTLETPDIIVEDSREVKDDGTSERETSYVFVKAFIKNDGSRYYYFTSITVSKDGREVVVSNQEKSRNRVLRLILEGNVIWRTPKDATTSSAEKQDLDYAHPKEAEDATKGSGITPQSISSESKDSKKSPIINGLGEKIAEEEKKVDTNPTEAQKEAGNYKKGHVRIGQFDVSIEQPKGSVRSGVDASGKRWEMTMQNTYGYIRGTEGVDGDHIDVFLTNDIDGWNGRRVYIVDQYNEDGTFDEHKVMLGFNDEADAQDAYLSNYEKGWENKRKLVMTSVNLPDFEKWINSSHRKTKPFAEYQSVNGEQKTIGPSDRANRMPDLKKQADEEVASLSPEIKSFAEKLAERTGMDIEKLLSILADPNMVSERMNEFGRYDSLVSTADHSKVSAFISEIEGKEVPARLIMPKFDELLREFILPDTRSKAMDAMSKPANVEQAQNELETEQQPVQTDGYTVERRYHKKNGTYINAVKFTEQMPRERFLELKKRVKDFGGYYSSFGKGGFIFGNEEDAHRFAHAVLDKSGEELEDAKPLSLADTRKASNTEPKQVDVIGLMEEIKEKGEAKLSDHVISQPQKRQENNNSSASEEVKPVNPSGNRLVTDERYEELKKRMKAKLGQLNVGIDPEIIAIGAEMAVYHIEKGARKFADYAKAMIADMGDVIRPYLKSFYNAVRDMPEAIDNGLVDDMSAYDEVRSFDVANFGKQNVDALATAELVVQEQELQAQADDAKRELTNQRNEQRRNEDEQTTTDTEAIASQAEAIADEAERNIENATDEQQINEAVETIDKQIEEVNKQLALLGYYEADPVEKDFNEAYGYMRNAEKKAAKDASSLAKRLAKDLGIENEPIADNKGKQRKGYFSYSNIAPAGGEIYIKLPLGNNRELKIVLQLDPDKGDNLNYMGGYMRIQNNQPQAGEQRWSSNVWLNRDDTYQSVLDRVRQQIKYHVPGFVLPAQRDDSSKDKSHPKAKKINKKEVSLHIEGSLFDDLFNENATDVEQNNSNRNENEVHLQTGTGTAERERGHEPRQNEPVGTGAEAQAERLDGRGVDRRDTAHSRSDEERGRSVSRTGTIKYFV